MRFTGRLRLSHVTRGLLALLVVHAVAVPVFLHVAFGTHREATIAGDVDQFLRRSQADDSWRPMSAARLYALAHPGEDIYQEIFFRRHVKFQYAPSSLLFIGHMSGRALNRVSWMSVWLAVAVTVLLFALALQRIDTPALAPRGPIDLAVACLAVAALSLTFHPLMKGYALGQIQVWVDALFALVVLAWCTGRTFTAGVLLGVACLIKPPLAPLALWALVRGERRMLAGIAAAVCAGLVVSVYTYGLASHLSYVRVLAFISPRGETYFPNQSMNGLLNRWLANGSNLRFDDGAFSPLNRIVSVGSTTTAVALLALALFVPTVIRGVDRRLDFTVAAITVTMMSPIAWEHHYGVVLPLLAVLAPACLDAAGNRLLTGIGLAVAFLLIGQFVDVAQRFAGTPLNPLQSYVFLGALLLLAIGYRGMIRRSPVPAIDPIWARLETECRSAGR